MSAHDLGGRMERAAVPDAEGAERRARIVVETAFGAGPPAARPGSRGRGRGAPLLAAVLVALAVATLAAALTPPGAAVAGWVKRTLGVEVVQPRRVALGPLAGGGRLLVTGPRGTYVVARDGTRTRLGSYAGATWSPRGLFVGAWRGRRLSAVAPDGRVAWSYITRGRVRGARWSPDGYRIAYLRDDSLAVVAGDGRGARVLDGPARPIVPAWRPGPGHVLAWVAVDGRITVGDVDTGRVTWRSSASVGRVRALSWSADRRWILARPADALRIVDARTRRVRRTAMPAGQRVIAAAWAPRGGRLALVTYDARRGVSTVSVSGDARRPFSGPRVFLTTGRLGDVRWSPDGHRLLVGWRQGDQWLFVPADGRGRTVAVGDLRRRFGGTPAVAGWCC